MFSAVAALTATLAAPAAGADAVDNYLAKIPAGQISCDTDSKYWTNASDAETFALVDAAGTLRSHYFGNKMKVNYLVNLKSGMCPEDCSY